MLSRFQTIVYSSKQGIAYLKPHINILACTPCNRHACAWHDHRLQPHLKMTAKQTTQNANRAPRLVRSASSPMGTNKASTADRMPQNSTETMGV